MNDFWVFFIDIHINFVRRMMENSDFLTVLFLITLYTWNQ